MPYPLDLTGRVALVTGAARGLGFAIASGLSQAGALVVLNGRDRVALEEAKTRLEQSGGRADTAVFDVTQRDAVRASVGAIVAQHGAIDVLVNNAGIQRRHPVESFPEDDWDAIVATNLTAPFLCAQAVIPAMRERGRGSIINTASFVAVMGAATSQISYTASKGGVLAMSRELGVQFARDGIRVNALCPGPVDTPLLRELFASDPERAARRMVHIPMGRFADAVEIANAVLFLASDESSFVTASTFLVDGGISGAYVTPL
jgi:NAD(P)-dependent dehydrogenase (short-subunit alcohol dehydrogenase family)